jgi:hypothetical protein
MPMLKSPMDLLARDAAVGRVPTTMVDGF